MATQTTTKRQAAAKKAAATRKRKTADRSAAATKASARRTRSSAANTSRSAQQTTKQATKTAAGRLQAATERLDALGRQAERALLIQIGAVAALRDALAQTAQTYTNLELVVKELDQFERRGARALKGGQRVAKRRRRDLENEARDVQRQVERQTNGLRADVEGVVERVKSLA